MTFERPRRDETDLFLARDITYLRDSQYGTPDKLNARILLHSKYATSRVSWFDWLHSQIEWPFVNDVLEVGCGTGIFWAALPESVHQNFRLVVTDLSPTMVESALAHARQHVNNVTGMEANVQMLPLEDASFDLVIANQMLYHAPNPETALAEIRRVLRPGGTLFASTIGPEHLREFFEIEAVVFGVTRKASHADVFGSVSGRVLLERDFEDVEWRRFDDELRCTDVNDVMAYLTTTPPGEGATSASLRRLRDEVERRVHEGDGVLRVTKDTGVYLARRQR